MNMLCREVFNSRPPECVVCLGRRGWHGVSLRKITLFGLWIVRHSNVHVKLWMCMCLCNARRHHLVLLYVVCVCTLQTWFFTPLTPWFVEVVV